MNTSPLKAGFARVLVTPTMGQKIPGYFSTRYADGVISDLYIQAVAFDDGENKALVFSVDAISIERAVYEVISKNITELFGIAPEFIYIHATHSHTAFRIMSDLSSDPVYADFYPLMIRRFTDCAKFALEDLKPCTFKIARGKAENISFNRRYEMSDGTFKTNPKTGDPNIVRCAGPVDESVQILRVIRDGGKEIIMLNFGTHPDTISGTKYCADWAGYVVDYIRAAFCDQVEALMLNGAQGDVNHCNRFSSPDKIYQGPAVAQRMARVLAGEVMKIYDDAEEIPTGKIKGYTEMVKIGKNSYDPDNVPLAREIYEHYLESLVTGERDEFLKNPDNRRIEKEGGRVMSIPEAVRIIKNLDRPEFFEVPISGLQVGRVGFIGIPGEPFTQIGMDTKKDSLLDMTIVNCLVNGSSGYFPTADAFAVGGYERSTSMFASDCAELVTKGCLSIRAKMEKE